MRKQPSFFKLPPFSLHWCLAIDPYLSFFLLKNSSIFITNSFTPWSDKRTPILRYHSGVLITQNWPLKRYFFVEPSGVFLLSAPPPPGHSNWFKITIYEKNLIFNITRENKTKSAPIMYWLPSIVLQLKMLKLGQESFSPWLWVMIQSCSSNKILDSISKPWLTM